MKRILVISPHSDDAELFAGASMARWTAAGAAVSHICLSGEENDRWKEFDAACAVLGVQGFSYAVPDTKFQEHRSNVRRLLGKHSDMLKPDLVIIPPSGDRHQDHAVVHEEAKRTFRFCSLLGFDIPYNEPAVRPTWYQPVTYAELMTKIKAVQCYESQDHKPYTKIDRIKALATVRGCEIRVDYAEAFEVIRWVA